MEEILEKLEAISKMQEQLWDKKELLRNIQDDIVRIERHKETEFLQVLDLCDEIKKDK